MRTEKEVREALSLLKWAMVGPGVYMLSKQGRDVIFAASGVLLALEWLLDHEADNGIAEMLAGLRQERGPVTPSRN